MKAIFFPRAPALGTLSIISIPFDLSSEIEAIRSHTLNPIWCIVPEPCFFINLEREDSSDKGEIISKFPINPSLTP